MADYITRLDIEYTLNRIVVIRADGREVYRGDDLGIVRQWKQFYDEQTPWKEISAKRTEHDSD